MSTEFEFSSPLTLLREWEREGWDLVDSLVIGYSIDLPFLERYFISSARALGARVTVLSDAHQATHADVDVRHAGRSYLHAYALCSGAFHPKLVVLANEQNVWVAIGSGNPTTSGWGHNAELWLVIRSTRASGPAALVDLAAWLTDLPTVVAIPEWISQILTEIAQRLVPDSIDDAFEELEIIGNLEIPIIDQLPDYRVDELALTAPFFDPKSRAVSRLVERLRPTYLAVAIQQNLSRYDGRSLAVAIERVDRHQVCHLDEKSRISHGKLIEWFTAGQRRALVGSPNLSTSALLRTTREGANCELAVLFTTQATLLPPGKASTTSDLSKQKFSTRASPAEPDQLVLLGARLRSSGIEVEFVTRAVAPVDIEISSDGGPGGWVTAHTIDISEPGAVALCCPVRDRAGTAVRARTEVDGVVHMSRVVFVTDLGRCQPRGTGSTGPRLAEDYHPEAFFSDADLAARFRSDFDRLLVAASSAGEGTAANSSIRSTPEHEGADEDRWGHWIADVEEALKPSLTGLLFPAVVDTALQIGLRSWSVDIDEGNDIADGDDEEDVDPLFVPPTSQQRTVPVIDNSARAAWRKWDTRVRRRIVGAGPRLPLEIRMLALRIHFDLLAAGLWGPDDAAWSDDLIELLYAILNGGEGLPEEVVGTVGAMVAIGVALLFSELKQAGGVERDFRAQNLWADATHVVALADSEAIEHHLLRPGKIYGRNASRSAVEQLVVRAKNRRIDPTEETRALLRENGIAADFHDGAWIAHIGDRRNRLTPAASIATIAGKPCAAVVTSDEGSCVVLWTGEDIAYADSAVKRWRLYRVVVGTPSSRLAGAGGLSGARRNFSVSAPDREIADMCAAIGVNPNHLRIVLADLG